MSTLQLDSNNDNNDASTMIAMDAISELLGSVDEPVVDSAASMQLERLLFLSGFFTLAMDLGVALYKPPKGVVFEHHKLAYYLTLTGIFAAALFEIATVFWLSCYGHARGAFVRAVLYASVVPLIFVAALGGFTVLIKP